MKNNYNVLVIVNEEYFQLSKIFLKSLLENTDTKKIKNILIGDIGLSKDSINYIKSLSSKIIIIDTGKNIFLNSDIKLHSEEWINAVCIKTELAKKIIEKNIYFPLIVMDVDMIVLKDFSNIIDRSKQIQICQRDKIVKRADGFELKYIASFFILNNFSVMLFLNDWIERIRERINLKTLPAYETPALCEIIDLYANKIKIGFLDENEISCDNSYKENTHIIHMKSNGSDYNNLLKDRISQIKNYDVKKIMKYLN